MQRVADRARAVVGRVVEGLVPAAVAVGQRRILFPAAKRSTITCGAPAGGVAVPSALIVAEAPGPAAARATRWTLPQRRQVAAIDAPVGAALAERGRAQCALRLRAERARSAAPGGRAA